MTNLTLGISSLLLLISLIPVSGRLHHLVLKNEIRKNVLLSKFAFNENGTLAFSISDFTVPTAVTNQADKFGTIGFTLSRGKSIYESTRINPHLCHLSQADQAFDALFFIFDFETKALTVQRSGQIKDIRLCPDFETCLMDPNLVTTAAPDSPGMLDRLFGTNKKPKGSLFHDYVPLNQTGENYAFTFFIRFNETQNGLYFLYFHSCLDYREHGFSNKVAVDFTVDIAEMNQFSHLSAGDIEKPRLFIAFSFAFALLTILWINMICKSNADVYFVHKLMTVLVILKVLSMFCHGMNYYFLSLYGQEREIWLYLYFTSHLLKGLLLFGTLILIGTGYNFFRNYLTTRDRNLFMIVLPLQVIDNIALVILAESEFASQQYLFWFEVFTLLDLLCCALVLFPIVWSIRHLRRSAMADGKEVNLTKIELFRRFYLFTIAYIYTTRLFGFFLDQWLPYNLTFVSDLMTESVTLIFFVWVGRSFRPTKANPYLRLAVNDDLEDGEAITMNGLFENVTKLNRGTTIQTEIDELIPGAIAGNAMDSDDSEDDSLLPKISR
ncbi:Seven transmembrane receptor family protein [Aphelenchoides bicaudatus]|nr:Seven transmembrane receptor family protein [Aphelenchoides bicaudatus]